MSSMMIAIRTKGNVLSCASILDILCGFLILGKIELAHSLCI